MPLLTHRALEAEMMDDFSIVDSRLTRALDEIRQVNRLLGGYQATRAVLAPWWDAQPGRRVRLLDVGTGLADTPEHLVRWAEQAGHDLEIVAVDANEATVAYAREWLDARLPGALRHRVRVEVGDARALPYEAGTFDVVHAALFLHHFGEDEAVALLAEMERVASAGVVVNDLHRHALAYGAIWGLTRLLPVSPMFRNDAPLSVRRAFTLAELRRLGARAGLAGARVRWHWAFRLTLSTL